MGEIRLLGYPLDAGRIPVREENRSKIVLWRSWGVQPSFADRLPHAFQEASGVHVRSLCGLKNALLLIFVLVPWVLFLELIFQSFFATRVPSEI